MFATCTTYSYAYARLRSSILNGASFASCNRHSCSMSAIRTSRPHIEMKPPVAPVVLNAHPRLCSDLTTLKNMDERHRFCIVNATGQHNLVLLIRMFPLECEIINSHGVNRRYQLLKPRAKRHLIPLSQWSAACRMYQRFDGEAPIGCL